MTTGLILLRQRERRIIPGAWLRTSKAQRSSPGRARACGIACLLRGDRVSDGRLVTGLFRHATPHAFRVLDGPEWAKDILGPRNDAVEFHRLIIAADYPISLSSGGFCMQAI